MTGLFDWQETREAEAELQAARKGYAAAAQAVRRAPVGLKRAREAALAEAMAELPRAETYYNQVRA